MHQPRSSRCSHSSANGAPPHLRPAISSSAQRSSTPCAHSSAPAVAHSPRRRRRSNLREGRRQGCRREEWVLLGPCLPASQARLARRAPFPRTWRAGPPARGATGGASPLPQRSPATRPQCCCTPQPTAPSWHSARASKTNPTCKAPARAPTAPLHRRSAGLPPHQQHERRPPALGVGSKRRRNARA